MPPLPFFIRLPFRVSKDKLLVPHPFHGQRIRMAMGAAHCRRVQENVLPGISHDIVAGLRKRYACQVGTAGVPQLPEAVKLLRAEHPEQPGAYAAAADKIFPLQNGPEQRQIVLSVADQIGVAKRSGTDRQDGSSLL